MSPQIITRRTDDGAVTIALTGEFDLENVEALRAALVAAVDDPQAAAVLVDLAGVEFVDSSAIGALILGYRQACARPLPYRVVNARGVVARILDITGTAELLEAGPRR